MKPNKKYVDSNGNQYAMYPNPVMNITQSINGYTSHRGTFAIDDAQENTGRSNGYAPCDMVCVATDYVNGNAIFWQSQHPVKTKKYGLTYIYMMVIHDNTANAYIGMKIKQGELLFTEGTAGFATGNHNHIEVGIGKYPGYMYTTSGYLTSWGATVYMMPGNVNPSDVFFIDDTRIIANGNLNWSKINNTQPIKPKPVDIITEHYAIKYLVDGVQIHKDNPNGPVVGKHKTGDIVEYFAKTVYNGHRWVQDAKKQWHAISNSEQAGVKMWVQLIEPVKPQPIKPKPDFDKTKLIPEKGIAIFTNEIPINIRKNSPTGPRYGFMAKGEKQEYEWKYIGNGHRYVVWSEKDVLCFCAVAATEDRPAPNSKDSWAKFESIEEDKPTAIDSKVKAYGIDVSEQNGKISLKGRDFVIIRASWGTHKDLLLDYFIEQCERYNIPYGLYHYSYALDEQQTIEETQYFLNTIKGLHPQLGCWCDMEDADHWKSRNGKLNKEHCTKVTNTFCDMVADAGYYIGVYSTPNWFKTLVDTKRPKWIAHWGTNDGTLQYDYSKDCVLYQFTSHGHLDQDVAYLDLNKFPKK